MLAASPQPEPVMRITALASFTLVALAACSSTPSTSPSAPPATTSTAQQADAVLASASGSRVSGRLSLVPMGDGVHIRGEVGGLVPNGQFGFHVHEKGDCSAVDATSAGGHFNPASSEHGRVGHGTHHGGDSDNILANDQGVAMVDTLLQGVTLGDGAATDILGKGVIVHADPDDYTTQPTGNAGARLACGVIAAAQ